MLFIDIELFASNPLTILCSTAVSNIRFVNDWKLLIAWALLREKQALYPQTSENAALSRDREQKQKYHLALAALPAFPCHHPQDCCSTFLPTCRPTQITLQDWGWGRDGYLGVAFPHIIHPAHGILPQDFQKPSQKRNGFSRGSHLHLNSLLVHVDTAVRGKSNPGGSQAAPIFLCTAEEAFPRSSRFMEHVIGLCEQRPNRTHGDRAGTEPRALPGTRQQENHLPGTQGCEGSSSTCTSGSHIPGQCRSVEFH